MLPTLALASLLLTSPSLSAPVDEEPDTVELKDGKELTGQVVYEDHTTLILRNGSRDREISMDEVARVDSVARNLKDLLRESEGYDPWRLSDQKTLAQRATDLGLAGEARVFWWRALAVDPLDEMAHEALGHRKAGKSWKVRHQDRWVKIDKVRKTATDFGKCWEFPTSHYVLRSNLELERTLDLALDLERLYIGFFDLFREDLKLYETFLPMYVDVHADEASFPERAGEIAYFQGGDNRVSVDASQRLEMYTLVHESVHQLIYNTATEERIYNGAVPAWLNEGLAEYIASSYKGPEGRLHLEPGKVRLAPFVTQARAKKPMGLSRVLNLGAGDFTASTDPELKYAQVYTLVHFLLHGQDERYRESFLQFIRGTYHGQGSSTHFKKAFEVKPKELEAEWRGYVLHKAG